MQDIICIMYYIDIIIVFIYIYTYGIIIIIILLSALGFFEIINELLQLYRRHLQILPIYIKYPFHFIHSFIPTTLQIILLLKSINVFHVCTKFHALLQITSHVIAYTSSCINPVLYAFLSENFRKGFKKVSLFNIVAYTSHSYKISCLFHYVYQIKARDE